MELISEPSFSAIQARMTPAKQTIMSKMFEVSIVNVIPLNEFHLHSLPREMRILTSVLLVLFAGTKSKKSNRRNIVEQAQGRAATLVNSFLDGPIAAIETTDNVIELLRSTRLSDPEVCSIIY